MKDRLLTVVYAVAVFFLMITFCISLPIYCRPFYYCQIEPLGLVEDARKDVATIREAYDEVMDYLTIPGKEFGTGVFKHSAEGAAHFADCKALFMLNASVLAVCAVTVAVLLILQKRRVVRLCRPLGMNANVFSAAAALLAFAAVGVMAAVDFDWTFEMFHTVCFPGQDNWWFSPREDAIIRILPEEFFMNCAVLIIGALLLICVCILIFQIVRRVKRRKDAVCVK